MKDYAIEVKPMKTGEPCPCCGQPIQTTDPGTLYVLGWIKTMSGDPRQDRTIRELGEHAETEEDHDESRVSR